MRRFWKAVTLEPSDYGYAVRLDGRPVKTPTGNLLALPSQKMADAVVAEWEAVEKSVNPVLMPNTGFANAAIDRIAPDHDGFAAAIAAYGETDNFCYRAAAGEALADRQAQIWDPWLDWARGKGIALEPTTGVGHKAQAEASLKRAEALALELNDFCLTGLVAATALLGSAVLALAVVCGKLTGEEAYALATLDERFQKEQWGVDAEAAARTAAHQAEARLLEMWFKILA